MSSVRPSGTAAPQVASSNESEPGVPPADPSLVAAVKHLYLRGRCQWIQRTAQRAKRHADEVASEAVRRRPHTISLVGLYASVALLGSGGAGGVLLISSLGSLTNAVLGAIAGIANWLAFGLLSFIFEIFAWGTARLLIFPAPSSVPSLNYVWERSMIVFFAGLPLLVASNAVVSMMFPSAEKTDYRQLVNRTLVAVAAVLILRYGLFDYTVRAVNLITHFIYPDDYGLVFGTNLINFLGGFVLTYTAAIVFVFISSGGFIITILTFWGVLLARMLLIYSAYAIMPVLALFWVANLGPAKYLKATAELLLKLTAIILVMGIVIAAVLATSAAIAGQSGYDIGTQTQSPGISSAAGSMNTTGNSSDASLAVVGPKDVNNLSRNPSRDVGELELNKLREQGAIVYVCNAEYANERSEELTKRANQVVACKVDPGKVILQVVAFAAGPWVAMAISTSALGFVISTRGSGRITRRIRRGQSADPPSGTGLASSKATGTGGAGPGGGGSGRLGSTGSALSGPASVNIQDKLKSAAQDVRDSAVPEGAPSKEELGSAVSSVADKAGVPKNIQKTGAEATFKTGSAIKKGGTLSARGAKAYGSILFTPGIGNSIAETRRIAEESDILKQGPQSDAPGEDPMDITDARDMLSGPGSGGSSDREVSPTGEAPDSGGGDSEADEPGMWDDPETDEPTGDGDTRSRQEESEPNRPSSGADPGIFSADPDLDRPAVDPDNTDQTGESESKGSPPESGNSSAPDDTDNRADSESGGADR